ncbi:hypothetical protein AKJ16_DCAP22860 [Drosera capensis]
MTQRFSLITKKDKTHDKWRRRFEPQPPMTPWDHTQLNQPPFPNRRRRSIPPIPSPTHHHLRRRRRQSGDGDAYPPHLRAAVEEGPRPGGAAMGRRVRANSSAGFVCCADLLLCVCECNSIVFQFGL